MMDFKFQISGFRLKGVALLGALLIPGCDHPSTPQSVIHRGGGGDKWRSEDGRANPQLLIPEHGIYAGAYIEFGDREDGVTLEKIASFDRLIGKEQAIVASSSYWGEQTFPKENMELIARYGAVPLVFWSPWDRPYAEGLGPDKYSLTSIIAGEHDAYMDMWADAARELGWPMIVSFANEANGSWFPWSGEHYGGGKLLSIDTADDDRPAVYHYEGPETFIKAFRHVVDRVRARGAKNVQFVLHLMEYSDPQEEWNLAEHYYPGADYVDWLGLSLYGAQFHSDDWAPFFPLFDWPYTELTLINPENPKPIMVCEWGCGELPDKGNKAQWIRDGFKWMKDTVKYPRVKACVFWHERWQNDDGLYSNLHVNSTPESLQAYREGVGDPFFLSRPILK
jgi:hypothetical protein